mmetsp:Transcript_27994/g.76975  ORF Transcript_27994/g.76975 Transcript_27994/m.76975 type:complete len:272 (-) Transcript_27994:92-907(-)
MPLDSATVQAALLPWLEPTPDNVLDHTSGVREEAQLILQILQHVEAVASYAEVCRTFSRTPRELHLAEALLVGGAAGELDWPRMLGALRAAAAAGSSWAPLWLGDLERSWLGKKEDMDAEADSRSKAIETRRRSWYIQAAERGHPDGPRRLAAHDAGSSGIWAQNGTTVQTAVPAAAFASAFAKGGGVRSDTCSNDALAADGTTEEEVEDFGQASDEIYFGREDFHVGNESNKEVSRGLIEASNAVCVASEEMGELSSLHPLMEKPLRSRL